MNRKKVISGLTLISITVISVVAYTFAYSDFGFLIYETHTQSWQIDLGNISVGIPKSFDVTVECVEESGEFLVTYFLEISGPATFCNDHLRLRWHDTDGADFTIGKNGDQRFSGIGTLTWNSSTPQVFKAGHKNNITLTLTFLTTASIGQYSAKIWVAFKEKPIEAKVIITPKTLNVKSHGQWVTAHIFLPEPYKEKDIDINSVKLWHNGDFVEAEWGIAIKHFLVVGFSRDKVTQMLKNEEGLVELTVTGLVNSIEFYGTDTITVIKPPR